MKKAKKEINTLGMSREEWLAHRKNGIGGSEVAALLGASPYKTAYDVWLDKTNRKDDSDEVGAKEAVQWGNILETPIADEYANRTGNKVARVNKMMFHENGIMFANIDRRIVGQNRILEVETAGLRVAHQWGGDGTDQIPDWYLLQVQHYLSVTGAEGADVAALIGGQELRIYHIERDNEIIAMLEKAVEKFWPHVVFDTPPTNPPSVDHAKALWGVKPAILDSVEKEDAEEVVNSIKSIQAEIKELQAKEKEAKGLLADMIGEHEAVTCKGKVVATWKHQVSNRFNAKKLKEEQPDIHAQYVTQSESRVLRIK